MQETTVTQSIKAAYPDLPIKIAGENWLGRVTQAIKTAYPDLPIEVVWKDWLCEVTQAMKAADPELPIKIAWEDWLREVMQALKDPYPELLSHPRKLLTIRQFSDKHPAFPQGSLRNLIFLAESRFTSKGEIKGNGLAIALVRIGRKLLIDESKFFEWIEKQRGDRP